MKAFLQDIILRPSCYDCKAKSGRSHSDITIADFWGIDTVFSDMDDGKGTSMVFINTDKGMQAMEMTKMTAAEIEYERVKFLNMSYIRSSKPHSKRTEFFNRIDKEKSLVALINDCTKPTLKQQIRQFVSRCKELVKRILIKANVGGKITNITPIVKKNQEYGISSNPKIVSINFRNKQNGWKTYCMDIRVK